MKPFPVAVIESLLAAGVQEFVVCAGARNAALIVVLAALGDKVRLWQHFDERAAGFFALGRIRTTGRSVAVVTTSGTAAAELLPAVIEAHYQGLPLVALTADRPVEYRGSGAPQAIEQPGLFSCYAEMADITQPADLETQAAHWQEKLFLWAPFHFNVCLEEPDVSTLPHLRAAGAAIEGLSRRARWWLTVYESCCAKTAPTFDPPSDLAANRLIMAGDRAVTPLWTLESFIAGMRGLLYAEASSGLRDFPPLQSSLLRCGDATLRHLPVTEVCRFGGVPAARYWRDLETLESISVHTFSFGKYTGLTRVKTNVSPLQEWPALQSPIPAAEYLARDAALYARLGELLTQFPNSEPALFRRLSQIIPHGASVLTGNSLAIREWNLCAEYGRDHRVHVLRGANGIDGNLSAFLGIAADTPEAWCITGDLTTLYDLNAPWMLPQFPPGRRRFVVIQNAGGKIFSRLPSLRGLTDHERSLMENPHTISLRGWADMWNMDHAAGGSEVLDRAASLADHAVIELFPDASETEAFWQAWSQSEKEIWAGS